jgi:predicted lipid-binding transport protein (Tim44 family)
MTSKSVLNRLPAVSVRSSPILSAAVALLMAFSAPVFAQSDPHHPDAAKQAAPVQDMQMPGGMDGMMGMMRGGGMMGMMQNCPMMGGTAHAEGRVAFLKAELAISDQQKAAWEAYAAAVKKNLEGMQAMRQTMMTVMQAKSPVERLDAHIAAMDGRVSALKELKPALAALYASLSDEQKKKADELLTGIGCMM